MKEAIRDRARELGFDDCRFTTALPPESAQHFQNWLAAGRQGAMTYLERNANKRVDPQKVLPGAKSVISLAVSYEREASIERRPLTPPLSPWEEERENRSESDVEAGSIGTYGPQSKGRASLSVKGFIARYARFTDYHDVTGQPLRELVDFIGRLGGPGTRSLWYVDTGPLLERDLAQRAGLGFVGKHTNLISRGLGNWLFLSEIITTLQLEPDAPEKNRCGSCRRCLDACPTGAITAPFQLDARLCISYLTIELKGPIPIELRTAIGNRIYGCDDCLAVCPWNRFARTGKMMKDHTRSELNEPDLVKLLSLTDVQFNDRFAGTPMLRAKRKGLLRNVCVALGNLGQTTALPALQEAAADPEPLIAEHARWAVDQIKAKTPLTMGVAPK
jgi:epoxyqueuosine reductase